jgi:hypothetical protein
MDPENSASLEQAWEQKYGYRSWERVFDRLLLLYQPLTTAETRSTSQDRIQIISATFRFFVRIELEGNGVTIELQLGTETLASYRLSDARGVVDSETIYSYLLFERPKLNDYPGIKEKFVEVCKVFLELFRAL